MLVRIVMLMRLPHPNKQVNLTIILYGGLVVFLLSTDPDRLPIGLLLLPIAWLFLCLFITIRYLLDRLFKGKRALSSSRRFSLAFLFAALPSLLLLLSSINQLTVRDVLLLLAVVLFGVFYVSRLKLPKLNQ
ncbi:MAG: hypothetical protein WC657_04860 [Candidatus Paceibacterota bacterium]